LAINQTLHYFEKADLIGAYYVLARDPAKNAEYLAKYRAAVVLLKAAAATALSFASVDPDHVQSDTVNGFDKYLDAPSPDGWLAGNEDAFALKRAGKLLEAQKAYADALETTAGPLLQKHSDDVAGQIADGNAESGRLRAFADAFSLILSLAAAGIGLLVATALSRGISRALGATTTALSDIVTTDMVALSTSLERLAEGDLTARFKSERAPMKVAGTDEIGALVGTDNSLAHALTNIGRETVAAAGAMRSSSSSMDVGIAVSERASISLASVTSVIKTTSSVAGALETQAVEMRAASTRVTENMASASAAV
jgi:hypothetical protein